MVQVNVAEVSAVLEGRLLLEAREILSEVIALEEDGRVVVEVEVEERDVPGVAIALQR